MSATSLVFAPHLPWWLLGAPGRAGASLMVALAFWRRARGAVWRAVFLALLLLFLANPILRREERAPLDDLVLLLSDRSPSQGLADRPAQLAEAEARPARAARAACPASSCARSTLDGESRQGSRLFTRPAARRWPRATARAWVPWWR